MLNASYAFEEAKYVLQGQIDVFVCCPELSHSRPGNSAMVNLGREQIGQRVKRAKRLPNHELRDTRVRTC